jgi:hypothetical protein
MVWAEQPMYFQLAFALDRVKRMAPQHPQWKDKEPFKSILAGDIKGALSGGNKGIYPDGMGWTAQQGMPECRRSR